MKLYSGPLSLFTAKVRVALAEKGLDYERIEVGWGLEHRYEPHHPDVVALNPKREVPVLVDDDVVVYDSTLILEYLEDRYPEPALQPREPALRARCRQLEAAADEILFPHVWDLIEEGFYPSTDGRRDEARLAQAHQAIDAHRQDREKELADRDFLCRAFSTADIGWFVFLNAAATLGAPVPESQPNLRAWVERMSARPAVARELEETRAFLQSVLAG